MDAMKELTAVSCVKFRPMKREDTYNIEFKNDPLGGGGCSSFVGWQNRKNQVYNLGYYLWENISRKILFFPAQYTSYMRN